MTIEDPAAMMQSKWPGLVITDLNIEQDRIEVTSYGDSSPQYVAGMRSFHVRLHCNEQAMSRLWAILQDENAHASKPAPPMQIVENGHARLITLPPE